HSNDTAVIEDRPSARKTLAINFRGLLKGELCGQSLVDGSHALEDLTLAFEAARMGAGQVNAVLAREDIIDGFMLEARGNEITNEVRDHEGDDDRIVTRYLKDQHHRSHGSAHDSSKRRAHADQGVSAGRSHRAGQKVLRHGADDAAQHGAQKQAGTEDAASVT